MNRRPLITAVGAVAAAAALVLASPSSASAHSGRRPHAPTVRTINSTVLAPYQLAVSRGSLYAADGGRSQVLRVGRHGGLTPVVTGPQPGEIAGVAFDRSGRSIAYTSTNYATGEALLTIKTKGRAPVVAHLSQFENDHNPDAGVTYGVDNPSQCVKDAFEPLGGASMPGAVDSHPYSVAYLGWGNWVVADAAGNDLLKVDRYGNIRVIKVLPRQPSVITAGVAAGLGLPSCVVGVTYNFEPVPTDVEVGRFGQLYVSLLPGGPEDPSLGARGSLYRVNAWTGHAQQVAGGFLGATNVALAPDGTAYVAELFAGRISAVSRQGKVTPYVTLPSVVSLEWGNGGLYAGTLGRTDGEGPGSLVRITR